MGGPVAGLLRGGHPVDHASVHGSLRSAKHAGVAGQKPSDAGPGTGFLVAAAIREIDDRGLMSRHLATVHEWHGS